MALEDPLDSQSGVDAGLVVLCGFLGLDAAYRSLANNINLYHKYPPDSFLQPRVWGGD